MIVAFPGGAVEPETIAVVSTIREIRGHKVLLDLDLARLYGVETKALNQAVKRNLQRFPPDFMFPLSAGEFSDLRSQLVTSSWGGLRRPPHAFTEQGVAMLSSVLRSERAIRVNVEIMRAFVRLRAMMIEHEDLSRRLDVMEAKYDHRFRVVFEAIRELITPPQKGRGRVIGFRPLERKV
jgi:hypothetical protein